MYDLHNFGTMMADPVRMRAYEAALSASIRPGMRVVDLGAGTGILAMLACRFGAAHVDAIEISDCALVGREVTDANGFRDRIFWHHGDSTEITLDQSADLIVSDLRGKLPLFRRAIPTLVDARDRFLKPDGVLLPKRDRCWISLIEDESLYRETTFPWSDNHFDFDWNAARHRLANQTHGATLRSETLISAPGLWQEIDYRTVTSPHAEGEVSLTVSRKAKAHGFQVWFECELADGIGYSAGPDGPSPEVYGASFFPFPQVMEIEADEVVRIHLAARLLSDDYLWTWDTQIAGQEFHQSNFHSKPLNRALLKKAAARQRSETK